MMGLHLINLGQGFSTVVFFCVREKIKYKKNIDKSLAFTLRFVGMLLNFATLYHLILSPEVICSHSSETIFSFSAVWMTG